MQNDWILDVLTDLRSFAEKNGLARLAEELDGVRLLAAVELAAAEGSAPGTAAAEEIARHPSAFGPAGGGPAGFDG
jgi:hypothetical protein